MKNIFCFPIFLFPVFVLAQSYYLEKTPDLPGRYQTTAHTISGVSAADKKKVMQMIDAVAEVVKKVYPQPIGADVGPYGGILESYEGGPSEFKNGPYRVYVTIPFYDLYKIRTGGTEASGEYASHIEIWINNINYILQANAVQFGNGKVYRAPKPGIAVNGFPKYNNMLLVLPSGKSLPWRPATKQEYLENFIQGLKKSLQGRSSTPGERQKIPDAENLLASLSPSEKKQIAYLRKEKYSNFQNGYSEFGSPKWAGFLNASDTSADQLVIIDENFYDKTLPRSSCQVIVIERSSIAASISAARPRPEDIKTYNDRHDRMNFIVRHKEFLPALQQLLGKSEMPMASTQKNENKKFVFKKINDKNIDRIVDSVFRNYNINLPSVPAGGTPAAVKTVPLPDLPKTNSKKNLLASRKLNTREELVNYIDELDRKFSTAFAGTSVTYYDDAATNYKASYGYWLADHLKESLLLAIRAAKQQPDNDCVINNLGATLSLCGIDYLAMPLYIVCLKKEPDNSTITNNIGQAWLGLGDMQQAEIYLKKAIAATRYHHNANNSLGYIYEKAGRKSEAIQCYENSLRGSFTFRGMNGLNRLDPEKAMKLINYIRHRYKQPDYINFNKYPTPKQCLTVDETNIRIAEHKAYQKNLDEQIAKYNRLKNQQKPLADQEQKNIFKRQQEGKSILKPFQPFANALVVTLHQEYVEKVMQLKKDLLELEKEKMKLELQYKAGLSEIDSAFEPRSEKVGEGNPDPTLDEEICQAKQQLINQFLPQFAENNEERFKKIIHANKDYLNDYLYWIRLAVFGEEEYRLAYYDIVLTTLHLLKEVRLTALEDFCSGTSNANAEKSEIDFKKPDCPLPIGIEIPFVIGKISLDCDSWGLEVGEALVLNIDHKSAGETTIAIGPGLSFFSTPKLGERAFDLNPSIDAGAKGQFFLTFEGSEVMDGGFLWEAEIDFKGLGKPAELKQNFTWAVNKGFGYEGQLTSFADRLFDVPPENPVNKNVKIYKPNN